MGIKVVLIDLSVILGCLVSNSVMEMRGYKTLNKYLSKIANPDREPGIYLEAAKVELKRVRLNPTKYHQDYQKCLEDFTNLETVFVNPQCTHKNYEIIETVAREIEGHKYSSRPKDQSPVRKVLYEVGLARAKKCRPVWPGKFEEAYSRMPSDVKVFAEFSNWDWLRQGDINFDFMKSLAGYRYKGLNERIINDAHNHVMHHSQNDPDECFYAGMILKYLLRPCIKYMSSMVNWVLLQAKYDAQMFRRYEGFWTERGENSLMPFYLAMAHDELCRVADDEDFVGTVYGHWWIIQKAEDTECFRFLSNIFDFGPQEHPDDDE